MKKRPTEKKIFYVAALIVLVALAGLLSFNYLLSLSTPDKCTNNGGNWLGEFDQCEYVSENICDELDGRFSECESACRNNPNAEICTMQCVPVCFLD